MQPLSPKNTFIASSMVQSWAEISSSPVFRTAAQCALLQMLYETPEMAEPTKHWDAYSRLAGARRVIEILSTLADVQEQAKRHEQPTLNYDSKK